MEIIAANVEVMAEEVIAKAIRATTATSLGIGHEIAGIAAADRPADLEVATEAVIDAAMAIGAVVAIMVAMAIIMETATMAIMAIMAITVVMIGVMVAQPM